MEAWRAVCAERGVSVPAPLIGDWSAESGYRAGMQLAHAPGVSAVLCANDEMATGFIRAMTESGRRVPDDVSVAGFDDIPLAPYLNPPLTTVQLDFNEIGVRLVDLLLCQIRGEHVDNHEHVLVPTRLQIRASTAAPRA